MEKGKIIMIDIAKLIVTDQPMEPATQEEIEKLQKSIKEVGLLYPLIVTPIPETNNYKVLDGRTRLAALKALRYSSVECAIVDPTPFVAVIPYDTEICRRHLTLEQKKIHEKTREKFLNDSMSQIIQKLIPELQTLALEMLSKAPVETDIQMLIAWASMPEHRQEQILEQFSETIINKTIQLYKQEIVDLQESRHKLEDELEKAHSQLETKEREFEQRLKDFAEAAKSKLQDIQENKKLVIPEDPEEKDKLIKRIEKELAKQYADEIKHAKANLEKTTENYKKLQAELEKKKEDIETLNRQLRDLKTENANFEETLGIYRETLKRTTDIDKTIKKFEGVRDDMKTLNDLMIERKFTVQEIGSEKKKLLKKVVSEIQDTFSETMDIVKDIA